jgi:polyhydroxyalkanoate synthesis regulator phasin
MTLDSTLLDRLRTRSEEVLTQVSAELMSNPRFVKALERAMRGKAMVEEAVRQALEKANIPTRTEFKKALRRIDALETTVAALAAEVRAGAGKGGSRRPRPAPGRTKATQTVKAPPRKASKKAKTAR